MVNRKEATFVALTGILALGIFAAAYGSTQMLHAVAQTSGGNQQNVTGGNSTISGPIVPDHVMTPTVSTSGSASTKVKPDKFSVTLGVETNGTTAKEAADRNAELMGKVIAALKSLGISDSDISTAGYSLYPVYSVVKDVNSCRVMEGYPIPPGCISDQEIVAYKAVNSVTVTLDVGRSVDAGQVIDTAVSAGANNVNSVYFFMSQKLQQDTRDSLIRQAIADAQQRAKVAADAVGMKVTGVQSLSLNDFYFPIIKGAFDAGAPTPILPGQQEVTSTVSAVFTMGFETTASEQGFGQREAGVAFLEERLPQLGIQIRDPMDIHMDLITHISDTEYHADFAVVDQDGKVHNGHIEVNNGEVAVAELDGRSIL